MSLEDESDISLADLSSSDEFSDLEDDALEEMFHSDQDQDEFEGFAFDLPEDMTWERQCFDVNDEPLTHTPDPTTNMPDSGKAINFFLLYFSEEIIGNIVEFTNKNAKVKQAQNWRPAMAEELKAFLAVLIVSNDLVVPRNERYFFHLRKQDCFTSPESSVFCHPVSVSSN